MNNEYPLQERKIGDKVYFLAMRGQTPFIHCGRIVVITELDQLNRRYIVEGHSFSYSLMDINTFSSREELLTSLLESKVIS